MNGKTKQRIISLLIYIVVGFIAAWFWHKLKNS